MFTQDDAAFDHTVGLSGPPVVAGVPVLRQMLGALVPPLLLSSQPCYHLRMHAGIAGFEMPEDNVVQTAAETMRILCDPTRLRLLRALSQGESSVACLAELTGATPTAVSQHLAKLRLAGLVKARREGSYMFYFVVAPWLAELLEAILVAADHSTDTPARRAS